MATVNTGILKTITLVKVTNDGTNRPLDENNKLTTDTLNPQHTKNNIPSDPDYIQPIQNLVACPLPIVVPPPPPPPPPQPIRVIQIENLNSANSFIEISSVEIGGFEVNLEAGESFPITGGKTVIGTYNPVGTSDQQIISVFSNNLTDLPVRLNVITSNPIPQCQLSNGFTQYMNVNLSTNPRINITLDIEEAACL